MALQTLELRIRSRVEKRKTRPQIESRRSLLDKMATQKESRRAFHRSVVLSPLGHGRSLKHDTTSVKATRPATTPRASVCSGSKHLQQNTTAQRKHSAFSRQETCKPCAAFLLTSMSLHMKIKDQIRWSCCKALTYLSNLIPLVVLDHVIYNSHREAQYQARLAIYYKFTGITN